VKLSVSLPDDDVRFLDEYASQQGIESRSAVLQKAVRLLRAFGLSSAYELAWQEWQDAGEADLWESTSGDGISS
jgi:Arc/MetJ-type ribon-helix-helix transcriptional regulator